MSGSNRPTLVRAAAATPPALAQRVRLDRLSAVLERSAARWTLGGCLLIVVLMRLPWLSAPLGRDEGGIALLAQHWGGGSLYGDYWLDPPPLLILLFKLPGPRRAAGGRLRGM